MVKRLIKPSAADWAKRVLISVLSLLFPEPVGCVLCGDRQGEALVCSDCAKGYLLNPQDLCIRCCYPSKGPFDLCRSCLQDPPPFNRAVAAGVYAGPLRDVIVRLKYGGEKVLAEPLGRLLANQIASGLKRPEVILPVPLHPERLATRGYNQAGLLARVVGEELSIPVMGDVLFRHRQTRVQASLSFSDRQRNVKGAFIVVKPWRVVGKTVLLIDDVYTTGSTVRACAQSLLQGGARRVDVGVVAVDI